MPATDVDLLAAGVQESEGQAWTALCNHAFDVEDVIAEHQRLATQFAASVVDLVTGILPPPPVPPPTAPPVEDATVVKDLNLKVTADALREAREGALSATGTAQLYQAYLQGSTSVDADSIRKELQTVHDEPLTVAWEAIVARGGSGGLPAVAAPPSVLGPVTPPSRKGRSVIGPALSACSVVPACPPGRNGPGGEWEQEWHYGRRAEIDETVKRANRRSDKKAFEEGDEEEEVYEKAEQIEAYIAQLRSKQEYLDGVEDMVSCAGKSTQDDPREILRLAGKQLREMVENATADTTTLTESRAELQHQDQECRRTWAMDQEVYRTRLEDNKSSQATCWEAVREAHRQLKVLGEERLTCIEEQMATWRVEEARRWETIAWAARVDRHGVALRTVAERCEADLLKVEEALYGETVDAPTVKLKRACEEVKGVVEAARNQAHAAWMGAFTRLVDLWESEGLPLAALRVSNGLDTDKTSRQCHTQLEFCIETSDPNQRRHLNTLHTLRRRRLTLKQGLNEFRNRLVVSIDSHQPTDVSVYPTELRNRAKTTIAQMRAHCAALEDPSVPALPQPNPFVIPLLGGHANKVQSPSIPAALPRLPPSHSYQAALRPQPPPQSGKRAAPREVRSASLLD